MKVGLFLSSEEYGPHELVEQARQAADAGMTGLWVSDHYHPWIDAQGQSPFVWSTVGAVSQACDLPIMTAVTCPTVRIHPAVIAHAAATSRRQRISSRLSAWSARSGEFGHPVWTRSATAPGSDAAVRRRGRQEIIPNLA